VLLVPIKVVASHTSMVGRNLVPEGKHNLSVDHKLQVEPLVIRTVLVKPLVGCLVLVAI
jgi:hypothetical protein